MNKYPSIRLVALTSDKKAANKAVFSISAENVAENLKKNRHLRRLFLAVDVSVLKLFKELIGNGIHVIVNSSAAVGDDSIEIS